ILILSTDSQSPTSTPFPYTTLFRSVREEVELLEHDPDSLAHGRDVDSLARDLVALEEDPPGVKRLQQVNAAKQRALAAAARQERSEEHTSELQSPDHLVCRLLLEKK